MRALVLLVLVACGDIDPPMSSTQQPVDGASAPFCGDGIAQYELGEECDDGNSDESDVCRHCTLVRVADPRGDVTERCELDWDSDEFRRIW